MEAKKILGLFFTRNVSLQIWLNTGLFEREKLLYEKYLEEEVFGKIFWFTYGSHDKKLAEDLKAKKRLHKRIEVIEMPLLFSRFKLGSWIYSFLLPIIKWRYVKKACIFKSNQVDGAWAAVIAKKIFGRPLVVRAGYLPSKLERKMRALPKWRLSQLLFMERWCFKSSDVGILTSEHDIDYIKQQVDSELGSIFKIPNFVDTELFRPRTKFDKALSKHRLVFCGRLSKEKNLYNLIHAVRDLKLNLDLIGSGELKKDLQDYANQIGASVNFIGNIPHDELASKFLDYDIFLLPSFSEGMPKTLIEAMACGLVCVGTDNEGISEIISDGKSGYLIFGTQHSDISDALLRVFENDDESIRERARAQTVSEYSLEAVFQSELQVYVDEFDYSYERKRKISEQ